jgi:hypothetical protein
MDIRPLIDDVMKSFNSHSPEFDFRSFVTDQGFVMDYAAHVSSFWPFQQVCATIVRRILGGPRAIDFLNALATRSPHLPSFFIVRDQINATMRVARDQGAMFGDGSLGRWGEPYRGLEPFFVNHAGLFFGRSDDTAALAEQASSYSLSALVGASGSGKSSVVRAGLCEHMGVHDGWRCRPFRLAKEKKSNPFDALARELITLGYGDALAIGDKVEKVEKLSKELDPGPGKRGLSLSDALSEVRARLGGQQCLLILDQFEEVFGTEIEEELRKRFLTLLLEGFKQTARAPRIHLLLSFRADFLNRLLVYPGWAEALQKRHYLLGPMKDDGLRSAIVEPAKLYGVDVDPGLVDRLVADVRSEAGKLPLLQVCLQAMWRARQARLKEALSNTQQQAPIDA